MYREGGQIDKRLKELFKHKDCSNLSILDLGTGLGANALYLAKKGAKVRMVEKEMNIVPKHPNLELFCNDVRNEKLYDYKYDVVLCLNILQFLSIKDIKKILPKILNSVKKDGVIYIQMFNRPVIDWINKQIENFKILEYKKWIQEDKKPYPHTHNMVSWIIKK